MLIAIADTVNGGSSIIAKFPLCRPPLDITSKMDRDEVSKKLSTYFHYCNTSIIPSWFLR